LADIVFVDLFGDEGLLGFLEEILQFKKSFEDSKRDGCELIQLIFTKHAAPAKKFALSVKVSYFNLFLLFFVFYTCYKAGLRFWFSLLTA